jgi:hypothetical protein
MELVKLSPEEKAEMDLVFDAAAVEESKLADLVLQKLNIEVQIAQQAQKLSTLRGEMQNRASIMGRMHGLTAEQKASYDRKEGAFRVETDKQSPAAVADKPLPLKSVKKEK